MEFIDWAAITLGIMLIFSGVRAIRRREAHVPERYQGSSAIGLGWLWIILGSLFICGIAFDIAPLKDLFRLFLQAEN